MNIGNFTLYTLLILSSTKGRLIEQKAPLKMALTADQITRANGGGACHLVPYIIQYK